MRVPHSIALFAIEWGQDAAEVERIPNKKAPLFRAGLIFAPTLTRHVSLEPQHWRP